jgi:hypothetical protein
LETLVQFSPHVYSFHSIILPKTQQPIFEKNPKKEKEKRKKLVSTYAGLAEVLKQMENSHCYVLEQSLFSELRWVFSCYKKGWFC